MAGTVEGGRKAAITNKARYGDTFYQGIGHKGGAISRGGGFSTPDGHERAVEAGRKGGKVSRRKPVEAKTEGSRYIEVEQKSWLKKIFK